MAQVSLFGEVGFSIADQSSPVKHHRDKSCSTVRTWLGFAPGAVIRTCIHRLVAGNALSDPPTCTSLPPKPIHSLPKVLENTGVCLSFRVDPPKTGSTGHFRENARKHGG